MSEYSTGIHEEATREGWAVAYRRGGEASLGYIGKSFEAGRSMIRCDGVPRWWEPQKLADFLRVEGWQSIDSDSISAPRQKHQGWLVMAKKPADRHGGDIFVNEHGLHT